MLIWSGCAEVERSRFVDYQEVNQDFEDFAEGFESPQTFKPAEKKDSLPLFMAAEFAEPLPVRRCAENVLRVHFLIIDIDKGEHHEFDRPLELIAQFGHVLYTSFSHDPEGQWKFRVLVKLTRPVDITEWEAFFPRAINYLELLHLADMKCSDACHMFYIPGGNREKYFCTVNKGPGLDVDVVLSLPLPEGYKARDPLDGRPKPSEILPEDERGEITEGLKHYFEAKLQNLVDEIYRRPYPGSFYDLKSHAVFAIARGVPHIMPEDRLRKMTQIAIEGRYRNAGVLHTDEGQKLRDKSFEQVDIAISEGMSKPWYPPIVNEIPIRPFTDLGLAERFCDNHHDDLCYEPAWDSWLTWNQKYWDQRAGNMLVQERMTETVRKIKDEAKAHHLEYWLAREKFLILSADANTSDELKAQAEFEFEAQKKLIEAIQAYALKSEAFNKVTAAIKLARSKPQVLADHQRFNKNPWLLNFNNGTVDLRTGEFTKHRREDYITRMVPHDYDPQATCPRFDKFLADCMLDNERMVSFLWRAVGYSAIGVTDEQKLFMLVGDGANGKSTFLNLLLDLFGQHGTGYGFAANSSNLLTNKGAEQHPTWRMDFAGVRFLGANEVEEGRTFAESLIKELTGSDMITGRKMRQDNWTFKPEFSLWMAMNQLPHIRGTDEGIWRRIVVIEWLANFKDVADKDLPRKLLAEAPGIWARIVREASAWHQKGLVLPREVLAASNRYRQEQDPLKDFVERWCVQDKDGQIERAHLWAAYEEYCTDTRTRTFHERKRFYAALEKQFTIKAVQGVRLFAGVRLKTPKERMDATPRAILARANAKTEEEDEKKKPN